MPSSIPLKPEPDKGAKIYYQLDAWPVPDEEWPLQPVYVEEIERRSYREFHEKGCSLLVVSLILAGGIRYRHGKEPELAVEAGSALIIPSFCEYSFRSMENPHYRKLTLELRGALLEPIAGMMKLNRWTVFKPRDIASLEARIRRIDALINGNVVENAPLALGETYSLMAALSQETTGAASEDAKLLATAKASLESSLRRDSVAGLAAKLGVCPSKLGKLFRKKLGLSPQEYKMNRRIESAERYLTRTKLPLKEIAERLGYANQLHFSNDFRKRRGMSPRAFRAKLRN